jgi:FtsZ-interacting cell division protein YlmF
VSIVQKFKSFWFGPADNYDQEDFEDLFETSDDIYATNGQLALEKAPAPPVVHTRGSGKVVDHPSAQAASSEVMVIEPRTFDESVEIVDQLRSRKSVLLNLHLLDNEQSQRIVDFLSGATHAIDNASATAYFSLRHPRSSSAPNPPRPRQSRTCSGTKPRFNRTARSSQQDTMLWGQKRGIRRAFLHPRSTLRPGWPHIQ